MGRSKNQADEIVSPGALSPGVIVSPSSAWIRQPGYVSLDTSAWIREPGYASLDTRCGQRIPPGPIAHKKMAGA